jgi:hypothetical protein
MMDDPSKISWLQRCAADKCTIDIATFKQLGSVGLCDTPTIQQRNPKGYTMLRKVTTNHGVHFLRLFGGGGQPCSNGPNGLIGNDSCTDRGGTCTLNDAIQLTLNHLRSNAGVTISKLLADTHDRAQSDMLCLLNLTSDFGIGLMLVAPPLAVSEDYPRTAHVGKHLSTYLAGIGPLAVYMTILCTELNATQSASGECWQDRKGRTDHNINRVVTDSIMLFKGIDELHGTGLKEIHLPVSNYQTTFHFR